MKITAVTAVFVLALTLAVLIAPRENLGSDELPKALPVPEQVRTKLEALFQEYYPKAKFTNQDVNGIRFEHEVAKFEFPYTGREGEKHVTTRKGPKKGGILCEVSSTQGKYQGAVWLPPGKDGVSQIKFDHKMFKAWVIAPYSAKRDVYLWAVVSYPPDVSEEFLNEFHTIIADFEMKPD